MAYTVAPINVTGTLKERVIDPRSKKGMEKPSAYKWWLAQNDKDLCTQLLATTEHMAAAVHNKARITQDSLYSRLFCGKPLSNMVAPTSKMDSSNQLPLGRPTANVCYACTDTLISRISQDRPQPTFLTEGGTYKQRKISQQANQFIQGELHRTNAYELVPLMGRDALVVGNGFIKVFSRDGRVTLERTLETELLTDYNDAYYGKPRQLIQRKLVDRSVFMELFPDHEAIVSSAAHGNADTSPISTDTIADQFIIAEGWHLRSGEDATDGRHVIACSGGILHNESYEKDDFPFAKFGFNPNMVGWFSQGLVEILMPTQMEIYRQLIVGSQNFELMGVPRVLVEEMSKILETSFNNRIGSIIKYRNTPPQFVNAAANAPEWFQYVQWLIANSFQMSGISAMSAAGVKPAGLNSGESIREFDGVQDGRFAALSKRYQNIYKDLSYLIIDCASDIVKETGKYSTVYPGKNGIQQVDFKAISTLKDSYIIQIFEESSLPKDPAGRQAKLSEMLAAQEITQSEFRRLSRFPDLEQSDQLANALEERILHDLDQIIDEGEEGYTAPDPFILDPTDMATTLTVQYINKYSVTDIEEEKMQLLRDYFTQIQDLKAAATPPPAPQMPEQGAALPVQPPNPSMSPTSGVSV